MKNGIRFACLVLCCAHGVVTAGSIMRRTVKNNKTSGVVSESFEYDEDLGRDSDSHCAPAYADYAAALRSEHTKELLDQRKRMQNEHAEHIKKLHQERDQLTAQLAQERVEKHRLEQCEADHKRKICSLEKDLALYKEQVLSQRVQIDEYGSMLTALKKSTADVQGRNADLQANVTRLAKERDQLAKHYKQQWEEQFAKSNQELTMLKQRMTATQERYHKSLQTLKTKETEVAQKDRHINELQGQLKFYTDRVADLEYHVRELNKNIVYEQKQRTTAQAQIRKLEQQQCDLRQHNELLAQQITKLKDSIVEEQVLQDLMPQDEQRVMASPAACVVAQK